MELKLIRFITIVAYSALVSQSFCYIIALRNVQESMCAESYIEIRKLLDKNFRAKYSIVFYSTFASSLLLVAVSFWKGSTVMIVTAVLALLAFLIDTVFMLKGNMPINNAINSWSADKYPSDWKIYRKRWLDVFRLRQIANITGFLILIAGCLFG